MKPLPFKMLQRTNLEKWRADTFWTKEPETIAWIDGFDGGVFYDIGANIGVYSLCCAAVHPYMKIFAFEPLWENFKALVKNVYINNFKNIKVSAFALGDQLGTFGFSGTENIAGASGGQVVKDLDYNTGVFLYRLDWLISLLEVIGYPGQTNDYLKPHYIKIDIDGQELGVLQGATETLKTVQSVLVEVQPKDAAAIGNIMKDAGLEYDWDLNRMIPHSSERRAREGIPERNIIYKRR